MSDGAAHKLSLSPGYELLKQYRIESVLGEGGFGITYKAVDLTLNRYVAIKECIPVDFATREGTTVCARSTAAQDDYEWAIQRFMEEARTLAQFDHPAIVKVYDIIEANGTSYMVTRYEPGWTLPDYLEAMGRTLKEEEIRAFLYPLLEGLEQVHDAGYLHRDIKPDNIYITEQGQPLLLDFGSARQAVGHRSRPMTSVLSPGYAPFEQYHDDGNQGPWSDLYSLAACVHYMLRNEPPPDAATRERNDPYEPLATDPQFANSYRFPLLRAIDQSLTPDERKRPRSVAALREALTAQQHTEPALEPTPQPTPASAEPDPPKSHPRPDAKAPVTEGAAPLRLCSTGDKKEAEQEGVAYFQSLGLDPDTRVDSAGYKGAAIGDVIGGAIVGAIAGAALGLILGELAGAGADAQFALLAIMGAIVGAVCFAILFVSPPIKRLYAKACKQDTSAIYRIVKYLESLGYTTELQRWRVLLLIRYAEQGLATAQNKLGERYQNGDGVPKNEKKAAEWYRKAAEQRLAGAQNNLANRYAQGWGVPQDDAKAAEWFRKAAEQGDADAQFKLGAMYAEGRGLPQDDAKAAEWIRKAAEQDHLEAQANLANRYLFGKGVSQDHKKAAEWVRKTAEKNHAEAQYNLGWMHEQGKGVAQDDAKAIEWFNKAAEQGHADAQLNLGVRYEEGRGVRQNETKAAEWYRKAAEQGHDRAQFNLGVLYAYGDGVPQDDAKAVEWIRKAAEQGYANAQYSLGVKYDRGEGVPQDPTMALKWVRKAAKQGHSEAKKTLEDISK